MTAAIIGPLISAGAGLLGKIFGGDDEEKTTSEIDYVKLRENAERAGFNPLTALRSGGGAGFTTTHHPALSSGQFIADAVAGIGNVIASIDPMRDATAKLEWDIKQATLANLQADTAARNRSSLGGVPVSTGARSVTQGSPLAKPRTLYDQSGVAIPVGPGSPAEEWESEYGEVAGEVEGFPRYIRDRVVPALTNPKTYGLPPFPAWPGLPGIDQGKALAREKRLRKEAAENARSLGFPGY